MFECSACGREFETQSARLMHVERQRCPEIDDQEDVVAADLRHAEEEMVAALRGDRDV